MQNQKLPFDYFAALDMPEWRQGFHWPLSEEQAQAVYRGMNRRIVDFAKALADDRKRQNLFLLAVPLLRHRLIELQVTALTMQAAEQANIELVATVKEANYLKTGEAQYFTEQYGFDLVEKGVKWLFLRRLAHTLSWTKWWRLPLVCLAPEAVAVAHNDILVRHAQLTGRRVYFYQNGLIFQRARGAYQRQDDQGLVETLAQQIFELLVNPTLFTDVYLERLRVLAMAFIRQHLQNSYHDLEALYQYPKLPKNLWVGSACIYGPRAVALAVLQRGGTVTSCAHATGSVLCPDYELLEFSELAATHEFVELTPAAAQRIDRRFDAASRAAFHQFRFGAIDGSPLYKKCVPRINAGGAKQRRPVVVYTPSETTPLVGPIYTFNMVYLDWQLRLVEILLAMDIELICQPHPQGIFRDRNLTHPLREAFGIPYRRFEEIAAQADVFLVDFVHSTIMGEMLASNKPVVRIALNDDTCKGVHADLRPLLDARCRNVPVQFGADNLPSVDPAQLQQSLLQDWQQPVDPGPFPELLLG